MVREQQCSLQSLTSGTIASRLLLKEIFSANMPSCATDSGDASDKCNIREVIQCFVSSEKLP